ncbi:MAG TPA: glycosyltransferase [Xanthobacteraceae bacterium]|jgi:glycosyltransferase involved in cell wall biosynthesis|nr:glycosyltransferase [Xanthobacteraceae bacterium]
MKIIVPRLVDVDNINAQNLSARSLLSSFTRENCKWHCACYGKPDPAVSANPTVTVTRLAPWRAWPWHLALFYQQSADAIFYPGLEWYDRIGLQWRDRTRRSIPIIATLEGLVGGSEREEQLSRIAGHPVYCHRVSQQTSDTVDYVLQRADHIIAISPFLAKAARALYGDKCSVLPLGVDLAMYTPGSRPKSDQTKKVVSVGNVRRHKRPEVFLDLAQRFSDAQFCWIGDGDRRSELIAAAAQRGLQNLRFPGRLTHAQKAEELRTADVFVMPSHSEGVPKVTQEAAASGIPCIVFGYYEPPSVIDGQNGYLVWSDGELEQRLGELLENPGLCADMGGRGRDMARAWDWSVVAPLWEHALVKIIEGFAGARTAKHAMGRLK